MQRALEMTVSGGTAYCLEQVRRFDRDRYLTALFAEAAARDDLMALYAFNLEVAKTRELVREPMMGLMRLQWWRDCIAEIYDGKARRHQVAQPLAAAIERHALPRDLFDGLIEAREADLGGDPPQDLGALLRYVKATAAGPGLLALRIVGGGVAEEEAVRAVCMAWGLTGLLRAVPFHAAQKRVHLPRDLLAEHGIAVEDLWQQRKPADLAKVARAIAGEAVRQLEMAGTRRWPRRLMPALMPGTLARINLRRLERADHDLWAPSIQRSPDGLAWRLLAAYLRGRF